MIPVTAVPTDVVPIPVIIPKSPSYETIVLSSLVKVGGLINTTGGFVPVYPIPGDVIVTLETVPPTEIFVVASALAVVPRPIGF